MASTIALDKTIYSNYVLDKANAIGFFLAQITTSSTSINKVDNCVYLLATQSRLEKLCKILPLF
jgi:hypothetical protein